MAVGRLLQLVVRERRSVLLGEGGGLPLYLMLYEQLCRERKEPIMDRGSPQHLTKVWDDLKSLEIFTKKGTRVKLGRWGSWFQACRPWDGQRTAGLLILLYMGVARGWWTDISDMPLKGLVIIAAIESDLGEDGGQGGPPLGEPVAVGGAASWASSSSTSRCGASSSSSAPVAPLGPSASALPSGSARIGLGPMTVSQSNQEVQKLKLSAKHHLAFCAQVIGNAFGCAVSKVVLEICEPITSWINLMKTVCTTRRGNLYWHIDLLKGSMLEVFAQSWSVLCSPPLLEDCGFFPVVDCELADVLFEVFASVTTQCYLSMLWYTERVPGAFIGLLDENLPDRRLWMERLRGDFRCVLKLMEEAHNSAFMAAFLSDLQWPSQSYCMDVWYMFMELPDTELTNEFGGC